MAACVVVFFLFVVLAVAARRLVYAELRSGSVARISYKLLLASDLDIAVGTIGWFID